MRNEFFKTIFVFNLCCSKSFIMKNSKFLPTHLHYKFPLCQALLAVSSIIYLHFFFNVQILLFFNFSILGAIHQLPFYLSYITIMPCSTHPSTIIFSIHKYCMCVLIPHFFLIHSFVNGHLGYFHTLAIVNNTPMNIGVHAFF